MRSVMTLGHVQIPDVYVGKTTACPVGKLQLFTTSQKMTDRAPPTAVISECPLSHSYPLFGNGQFCCKWYKRVNDTSKHPLCDGGMLRSTDPLECCPDGDYEVCDGGRAHCKQIVDYSKHCFTEKSRNQSLQRRVQLLFS